ncbi:tetratricopeptide repeat protein [Thalassospira mesophila]|uniref:tetratricopeptide repeat protein n=1 Tax=Thalassospira mesophila TaxID=1293891 RepID=UPI000A1DC472|nr:tetratricopeptide repeat protein [Thalassospira mesophila]
MAYMQPVVPSISTPTMAQMADLAPETLGRLRQMIGALPDIPARLRVMGHGLLDLGLNDLARDCFGRALLADDLDSATHLGLVRAYLQKNERAPAMEHLKIAIGLRPEIRDLRVVLADLLRDGRQLHRALDQLAQVLTDEPAHAGARRGLADLLRSAVLKPQAAPLNQVFAATSGDAVVIPAGNEAANHATINNGAKSAQSAPHPHQPDQFPAMVWGRDTGQAGATLYDASMTMAQNWYWMEPNHPALQ